MRAPFTVVAVVAVALLTAGGCAQSSDGPGAGTGAPTPSPATPTPPAASPGGPASVTPSTGGGATLPDDLRTRPAVAAAIADLSQRQGIDPAQVVIAGWTPVTWNDGSLGCPREGMGYTQVQVDGQLLVLRVDTALFQYHARGGGPFAYCANPSKGYSVS